MNNLNKATRLIDTIRYQVFVAVGAVAGNEFGEESGEEKHQTEHHGKKRKIEQRLVGDLAESSHMMRYPVEFLCNQNDGDDNTDEERQCSQASEEVHRLLAELRHEIDGEQV